MRDYCDVLRSHAPDSELAIEVLRYATSEVLDGEFNGDVLAQSFSFADEGVAGAVPAGTDYADYMTIRDDTGTISVTVPTSWADYHGVPTDLGDDVTAPSVSASPDLDDYATTWATPGVEFLASPALLALSTGELLDAMAPTECTTLGRDIYDDGYFIGEYETFGDCGGTDTQMVVVSAVSADGAYGVVVGVQIVSVSDIEALDKILGSFNVTV